MANPPLTDVVLAACDLKSAAPGMFRSFCDTLKAYELTIIAEMGAADATNELFRAQGKYKTIRQLRKHISECYELRDQYTGRKPNG